MLGVSTAGHAGMVAVGARALAHEGMSGVSTAQYAGSLWDGVDGGHPLRGMLGSGKSSQQAMLGWQRWGPFPGACWDGGGQGRGVRPGAGSGGRG